VQGEIQFNLTEEWLEKLKKKNGLEILAGASQRTYLIVPDGNYFINPVKGEASKDIQYGRATAFLSLTKTLSKYVNSWRYHRRG
jgi:iron complex outermembrane receptor protein